MKKVFILFTVLFISIEAFSQGSDTSPSDSNSNNSDDLAQKIANKINACESMTCFIDFYNRFAKVTSGFSNKKTGKNIMVEILKLMDKKKPGLLFDVYMKSDKKYQSFFIDCVKLLPQKLRDEMVRKAKNYNK
jgi:hypothetical protein